MKIVFSDRTLKELEVMDHGLRKLFVKHAEKVSLNPQKRHLRFGLLFNVEEVTKQARMVFQIEKENHSSEALVNDFKLFCRNN